MTRRNADTELRRLERAALGGDRDAALKFGLGMARAGDLDLVRINAARTSAGLETIPDDASRGCVMYLLGAGDAALVRVTWDELTYSLDLEEKLIYFDGKSTNVPDWLMDQAHDDAGFWIEDRGLEDKLTEDQKQAVVDQYYYAIEAAWMPQAKITRGLIQDWIIDPINRVSEAGRSGVSRSDDHVDEIAQRVAELMCQGPAIEIASIDTRMGVSLEETGVTFKVMWPIWLASYELGNDDGVWRDGELDLRRLTGSQILNIAREARHSQEVRVELPEQRFGWEYEWPGDKKLLEEIRKAAPKKVKKKPVKKTKKRRKNMGMSEAEALKRDLQANQITPAYVERRLRDLKTELDDAVYFKRPAGEIGALRARAEAIEAVLRDDKPPPEGPAARRERLEQEAFARAKSVEDAQRLLDAAERKVSTLDDDVREAVRMRDPEREIQRLKRELADAVARRDAARLERDAALAGLRAMEDEARRELAGVVTPSVVEPVKQRRTFDGRLLDDETAREIDRLLDMVKRGSLTRQTIEELLQNARRQYDRAGSDQEKQFEAGRKLMVLDHVLHVAFKKMTANPLRGRAIRGRRV